MIIDVSRHQGKIDWDVLAPYVDFVFVKATGDLYNSIDPQFHRNARACIERNIPLHVFHFTRAHSADEARKEARLFVETARQYNPMSYVLDLEEETLADKNAVKIAQAFMSELRKLNIKKIGFYTGHSAYTTRELSVIDRDYLWIARYGDKNDGNLPDEAHRPVPCDLWQYTSQAVLPGITENTVDVSTLWGDKPMSYFTQRGDDRMATVTEMRKLAADYMRQRNRKNTYTQGADRVFFFGKPDNQPGDTETPGYSDCSAAVRAAIKAAAGIDIGQNTDQQIRNRGRGVIVEEPNGVPDEKKLLPGDCLYFRGNANHIYQVGHVEMYVGGGKLRGHGGGMGPYESDMRAYCKKRPCFMVIRWILGGEGDTPDQAPQRPTLRRGDCGDAVRDMQLMLIDQDYNLGKWGADGEFGRDTENALKLYQAEHDLEPDGICGPLTWAMLESWAAGDTDETPPVLGFVTVKAGTWRIRSGPGTQYGTVGFVRAGDKLRRTADTAEGWLGVVYEGCDEWISEKAVEA